MVKPHQQLSLDELMQSPTKDVVLLNGVERINLPDPSKKMSHIKGISQSKVYSPKEIVEMGKNPSPKDVEKWEAQIWSVQRAERLAGHWINCSKPVSYIAIPGISSKIKRHSLLNSV